MTKKFVSLVLSLALVIGLIPMMSVSADESAVTILFKEDFTNFDLTSFNSDGSNNATSTVAIQDKSETTKFTLGGAFTADIVNMPGYDGQNTNVLKLNRNALCTSYTSSYGGARLTLSGLSSKLDAITSGTLIYELKMYIPSTLSDGTTRQDINGFYMSPFVKNGEKYSVGTSSNDTGKRTVVGSANPGQWYDLKYVMLLDETTAGNILVYCGNDLVSYKERNVTAKGYRFQFQTWNKIAGEHIIFDDFKIWHNPNATTVSSVYSDASGLSKTVSPVVTFSESVLDYSSHSDGRIADKVELIATSGATPVDIDIDLSNDGKTLTIDPTENLNLGTEYTVKLTGLVDMYGREITDTEFNFTTAEASPITVSQPVFTKENLFAAGGASQTITALENGYIKASATVSNSANTSKDVMVLSMLKEGEDIKYFQFDNITVPAKGSAAFTGGFQIDNASTQKIETVVWDNITNKTPLADKYAFSSSGYVKTDLDTLLGE